VTTSGVAASSSTASASAFIPSGRRERVALDEHLGRLAEAAREALGDQLEGEDLRRVGRQEVGERELRLEVGEPDPARTAERDHDGERERGDLLGEHGRATHQLRQQARGRRTHAVGRQGAATLGSPVEQHADRRDEGEHQDERRHDADRGHDAEVDERRDRVEHVREEPDDGRDGREHERDADRPDRAADRDVDGRARPGLVAVARGEVDAVVDAEADEEDRDDLRDLAEVPDEPAICSSAVMPCVQTIAMTMVSIVRPMSATCGARPAARAVPTRAQPVDEQQHADDDRERGAEQASELGLEVERLVVEQQAERERAQLDRVGREALEDVGDRGLARDLRVEVDVDDTNTSARPTSLSVPTSPGTSCVANAASGPACARTCV
jgi:hypothetical protein